MSSTEYYYAKLGETHGPFSEAVMKEYYENEKIFPETLIWGTGMTDWVSLSNSGLSYLVAVRAPSPKPPGPPPPPTANPLDPVTRQSVQRQGHGSVRRFFDKSVAMKDLKRASRRLSLKRPSQVFVEMYEPGTYLWIEDPVLVWELCLIEGQDGSCINGIKVSDDSKIIVDTNFQETHKHNPHVVSDMTSLHYLHEPAILYNLGVRNFDKLPYTYMGSVLIAVNPLQAIPNPELTEYIDKYINPYTPHPYAMAGA